MRPAMLVSVVLTGFACVMTCVQSVAVRNMRVVRGRFVIAGFVMLSSSTVMFRRVFVMVSGGAVMLSAFVCHGFLLMSATDRAQTLDMLQPLCDAMVRNPFQQQGNEKTDPTYCPRPLSIGVRRTPIPSISISTTSPGFRNSFRSMPVPAGVPVEITSPG